MDSRLTPVFRIVPEGWVLIALWLALASASMVAAGLDWALLLPLAAAALTAFYCNDAPRHSTARPLGVLAPVDGVVTLRRECHDPDLGREAIRICVRLPWRSNYCWRAPVEGTVEAVEGMPAGLSVIRTDEGDAILWRITRGWAGGRRPVWGGFGSRVGQGRRCGLRRLVSEIELLLPAHCRVEVVEGQTIRCGETTLATLLRRTP